MAKKKKGSKRRYTKKRSAPKKDRATPLGATAGAIGVGNDMLLVRNPVYFDPVTYIKTGDFTSAMKSLVVNAKDMKRYKYGAFGLIISAAPKLPLVSLIAKPADKAIRRVSKGKVSL